MPQGVEHETSFLPFSRRERVKLSLMPQGVEHSAAGEYGGVGVHVKLSLMPQGVEHAFGNTREIYEAM